MNNQKSVRQDVFRKSNVQSALFQIACVSIGVLLLFPVIYCVIASFMTESEIVSTDLNLWPKALSFTNYIEVIHTTNIFHFMGNSFIVALVSSLMRILTSSLASYAFTFFEFKGKKILFSLVVATMIIPAEMLMVQNYFTTAELGLINTYPGMMIIYMVSASNIFLMRQNFMGYSMAVREAAKVDGCGNFKFFCRILMPMSTPVIATVFISSFVTSWNTYLWPLLVTNKESMRTVQIVITMLNKSEINSAYGQVMAASVLILIPSIIVFVLFQRQIVSGMTAGAVKE